MWDIGFMLMSRQTQDFFKAFNYKIQDEKEKGEKRSPKSDQPILSRVLPQLLATAKPRHGAMSYQDGQPQLGSSIRQHRQRSRSGGNGGEEHRSRPG